MRELTESEINQIDGGAVNLVALAYYGIQAAGTGMTGYGVGTGVNWINRTYSNMSLGEAIYRTIN